MQLQVMQMAKLPPGRYRKRSQHTQSGLTLIEVLVALAIISIALTAIIKATSENIRGTAYLQDKTIAMYVARQILNEKL
jgi:prepilin-type N-terminal cleavage/methylation domain-containing protein